MKINEISKMLYKKKLINSEFVFDIWIKLNFLEKKIRFGEFQIIGKNSIYNIAKTLISGKFVYRKFTLVEGMYKYQLIEFLNKIDPSTSLKVTDIPDNLIADTYSYVVTDSERVLENLTNFSKKFLKGSGKKEIKTSLQNIEEMYILASIVEKKQRLKVKKVDCRSF